MTFGAYYLSWEVLFGIIVSLLLLGNMIILLRRNNTQHLNSVADTLFRGQAELAGRLS